MPTFAHDEEIQPQTRTLSSLVLACLFTFLSCAWCTIRPDIPAPHDSKLRILITKLNIIFWVLVSPEMVAFWSFRQWYEAGKIAKEFRNRGWTRRHGLFLLMGGFMMYRDNQPIQTLSVPQFRRLIQRGVIDFPLITTSELKERGSPHPTLIFLVVLQSTWFITQCLSRLIKDLVITQLEVITLVLLVMNGLILVFTYQKPLDIRYPVRINATSDLAPHLIEPFPPRTVRQDFRREREIGHILKRSFLVERRPQSQRLMTVGRFISHVFNFTFVWPIRSLYQDFGHLAFNLESNELPRGALKVPLFFVPDFSDMLFFIFPALVGMGVGVVNCLFWSWGHFPSDTARLVWRISSVTTAAFCALFLIFVTIIAVFTDRVELIADFFILVSVFIFLITFIPYVVARVIIILESFVCLQSLPREAFEIVPWTDYLPHFS